MTVEHLDSSANNVAFGSRSRQRADGNRKLVLILHIAASTSLLGADLGLLALGVAGRNGAPAERIYPAMSLIGSWVLAPLAVAALATGLLLVALTPYSPVRHLWLTIKLIITLTLTALVISVVAPGLAQAAEAATGPGPSDVLTSVRQRLYVIIPAVSLGLLLLNVALAVYKPSRRRAPENAGSAPRGRTE